MNPIVKKFTFPFSLRNQQKNRTYPKALTLRNDEERITSISAFKASLGDFGKRRVSTDESWKS